MISAGTATAKTYSDRPSLTLSESRPASAAPQPIRTIPKIGAMMARAFTDPAGVLGTGIQPIARHAGVPRLHRENGSPAPAAVAYLFSSTWIGVGGWLPRGPAGGWG